MEEIKFYVSNDGNDNWSGKIPFSDRDDGPFATLERAKKEINNLKKSRKLNFPVYVYIRGGIYHLEKPLIFTPQDSGTPQNQIIYTSYKNEKVILSGGKIVKEFDEIEINGKKGIRIKIEKNLKFSSIWVNGKRRYKARFPRKGLLEYKREKFPEFKTQEDKAEIEILRKVKKPEEGEIVFFHYWVDVHLPIKKYDRKRGIAYFEKKSRRHLMDGEIFARYYIENIFEFIDRGFWYYDRENGFLYYIPFNNEKINEIIYPVNSSLIEFEGCPEKNEYVEFIKFKGLTFSFTDFQLKGDDAGDLQAAVSVEGAIRGNGIKNCSFEDCEFTHLGNYGIEFLKGCKNNTISNCKFFDLGGGGIKIGEPKSKDEEVEKLKNSPSLHTFGNKILNCYISYCGKIFYQSVGIIIFQSYNNLISGNHIHDLFYTGISVGWTWGYTNSLAYNNIIEYNHIHHIGKLTNGEGPYLSDMGGIYTLGIQPGTILRRNIIHDISAYRYGGWGIYLDEGTSYAIVEENIVYKTTHGGFHQHYGRENIIRNNIFAFGRKQQIQITRPEPHKRFIFEQNIVVGDTEKWIEGGLDFNFIFDKNLYWNIKNKEIKFVDRSGSEYKWEEWKEIGMDKNSIISDPLFYDIKKFDFRMKKNSPAFKLGFKRLFLQEKKL